MATQRNPIPLAEVVELSPAGDLVVVCPVCKGLHRHGARGGLGLRTMHCADPWAGGRSPLSDYQLVDPRGLAS